MNFSKEFEMAVEEIADWIMYSEVSQDEIEGMYKMASFLTGVDVKNIKLAVFHKVTKC